MRKRRRARQSPAARPVPRHVLAAADQAFDLRYPNFELAAVTIDSLQDGAAGDGATEVERRIVATADDVLIDVCVEEASGDRRLVGRVVAVDHIEVHIDTPSDRLPVRQGEDGSFQVDHLPRGPLRVVVSVGTKGRTVATPWLLL